MQVFNGKYYINIFWQGSAADSSFGNWSYRRSWAIGDIFMRFALGCRLLIDQYRVGPTYPDETSLALGCPSGIVVCGQ